MRSLRTLMSALSVLAVCSGFASLGQSTFGTILGTVKDNSGAVVPRATVRITNTGENVIRTVSSDSNGDYVSLNMLPGAFRIAVSAAGFQTSTLDVQLDAR